MLRWFAGMALAVLSAGALAVQEVRVGAYHFPPYVISPAQAQPQIAGAGLLPQLLQHFNQVQADYRFVLVPTSSARRYRDFEEGRFDLIFFEAPNWGWQDTAFEQVDMRLEDTEVFVARAQQGRDQRYFAGLRGKRLALLHGYHYAFADFNADQNYLAANYAAQLNHSADSNLQMVLHDRADVALVTRSYLHGFLRTHPRHSQDFLIAQRVDQVYRHRALVRPGSPFSAEQLKQLLERLQVAGVQQTLFGPLGIRVVPLAGD